MFAPLNQHRISQILGSTIAAGWHDMPPTTGLYVVRIQWQKSRKPIYDLQDFAEADLLKEPDGRLYYGPIPEAPKRK